MTTNSNSHVSQYEPYWKILLEDGILVIQVPAKPERIAVGIKKALIKRKYNHRLRSGIVFNPVKVLVEEARDSKGKLLPDKVQLTFKMHNLRMKDI